MLETEGGEVVLTGGYACGSLLSCLLQYTKERYGAGRILRGRGGLHAEYFMAAWHLIGSNLHLHLLGKRFSPEKKFFLRRFSSSKEFFFIFVCDTPGSFFEHLYICIKPL